MFTVFGLTFALSGMLCLFLFGTLSGMIAGVDVLYDSAGYRKLGQSLWGADKIPASRLAQRGYLYPLMALGAANISPLFLIFVQMLAVSGAVTILVLLERRLTGRILLSPLALVNVSLLLSPVFMMTEALALLFVTAAVALCASGRKPQWSLVLFFIAALVKPSIYPIAILAFVMMLPLGKRLLGPLVVVLILLAPQAILTVKTGGKIQFSSAGKDNFQERFYPAVAGTVEGGQIVFYRDDRAKEFLRQRPELAQQVRFVLSHPGALIKSWGKILIWEHLLQQSGFIQKDNIVARDGPRNLLSDISFGFSFLNVALLLPAAIGLIRFLKGNHPTRWTAALCGPTILASAPLVYWQGDRIVFIGLVVMLPFAGLGLQWIWHTARMRGRQQTKISN